MAEIIYAGTIISLVFLNGFQYWYSRKEREDLIRALISRNAIDYSESKTIENSPDEEDLGEDLIPLSSLDDKKWRELVNGKSSKR